jgi:hypothetical protein
LTVFGDQIQIYSTGEQYAMSKKAGVTLVIPADVWQPFMEVRAQLDGFYPGPPTPIEEALREIVLHYKSCPRTQDEIGAFCERAKAWKEK